MKKTFATIAATTLIALTGCTTAAEAEMPARSVDVVPFEIPTAEVVEVPTDVAYEAPKFEEIPAVEQTVVEEVAAEEVAATAWEAWDVSGAAESLQNGGRVEFVEAAADAYVFEVTEPAAAAAPAVVEVEVVETVEFVVPEIPPVVDAQQWVRDITGNQSLTVWVTDGLAWEGSTCDTTTTVLCEVAFEDGSVAYHIHSQNVGKAGARAVIVDMGL